MKALVVDEPECFVCGDAISPEDVERALCFMCPRCLAKSELASVRNLIETVRLEVKRLSHEYTEASDALSHLLVRESELVKLLLAEPIQ